MPALPFELTLDREIEVFGRTLLALLRNEHGAAYVRAWCDGDDELDRWIIFRANDLQVHRYLLRDITLRQLILDCPDGYVFLADETEGSCVAVGVTPVAQIPEHDLPRENSFHDPALDPGAHLDRNARSAIVNGTWKQITEFPALYARIYASVYVLGQGAFGFPAWAQDRFQSYLLKGSNWPIGKMFDFFEKLVPEDARALVKTATFASPGFLRIQTNPLAARLVDEALARMRANEEAIEKAHSVLGANYRGIGAEAGKDPTRKDPILAEQVEDLARALGVVDLEQLRIVAGSDYAAAACLLSYKNKLSQLAGWMARDLVKII